MVGVLVKWLGIVPSFAYNLILPTLFSMVAMGAFSIAWNLIYKEDENGARIPRFALASGVFASFGMVVLGNLGTLRMIWRGYQKIGIPGGLTADTGLIAGLVGGVRGMWLAVTGTSLPYSIGEWYWIPSRVIPAPGQTEPITEFPYFSFIYADLHAHLMALPLALLALAWAISVVLAKGKWRNTGSAVLGFVLGGMAIGALGPTNTWDFYTYLAIELAEQLLENT